MGVGKSLLSSLSDIQSLQFNVYFADESQVFKERYSSQAHFSDNLAGWITLLKHAW